MSPSAGFSPARGSTAPWFSSASDETAGDEVEHAEIAIEPVIHVVGEGQMRGRLLTIIVAGFLIGALGGAAALVLTRPAPTAGTVISTGKADIGGPFSLIDQHGKTAT